MGKSKMKITADTNLLVRAAVQDDPDRPGRLRSCCSRRSWLLFLFQFFVSLCGCCVEAIRNLFLRSRMLFVAS